MNARDVRREFRASWQRTVMECRHLATDIPAKREAFSAFVDMLHREGRISDGVAFRATID